ncbi:phosphotransferase enzyme family protein [Paenibacillus sp. QZ-Y1]|uniref:phosphotransferase enzyme family protein n=1 Tax=Paenibacillus sp. QZ-Y1 TaxID=3414511 RepID=UPI003F78E2BC
MKDFFQNDTDENRLALLARARKVALSALQQYELAWERIQFIQLSDTITYKIETKTTGCYLLRIHSHRLSKEEIRSELTLLQALNKLDDLHVPDGVASCNGSYVLEINTEEGYKRPYVTMMKWVEGEHITGELTESCAYHMGAMMGRLHEAASCFIPPSDFVRPLWAADNFRREMSKLERYYTRFLSTQAWKVYQTAAEKILSELAGMDVNEKNHGIIHADLHTGNIVFRGNRPFPIDFGRCGYGYFLYDMAGTLLGLNPKQRWEFIKGYESLRKLEKGYERYLECFFIMFMIENYCHHASDPRETPRLMEEQEYAQAYLREYLMDAPFLFKVIETVEMDRSARGEIRN